MFFMES